MTTATSQKLRDALERLDLALDHLEEKVKKSPRLGPEIPGKSTKELANRLDAMIEQLEFLVEAR